MGAVTSMLALSFGKLSVEKLVLVSSPSSMSEMLGRFNRMISLPDRSFQKMRVTWEARVGRKSSEYEIGVFGPSLAMPTLLFHDKDDQTIPFDEGKEVADTLPDARMVQKTGLGHNRILRDPLVIEEIIEFLSK